MFSSLVWNGSLDVFTNLIIWFNIFGASVAAVVNFRSAKVTPEPWARIRLLIGIYACIYVMGYAAFFSSELVAWSSVMRGVSIFSWFLVWIAPAWVSTKMWNEVRALAKKAKLKNEGEENGS